MDEMNSTPVQNPQPENPGKICPRCGKTLAADAAFCNVCGYSMNGEAAPAAAPAPAAPAAPAEDTRPLKTSDYLLMFLLMCVPLVSFIIFMIWAFSGGTNVNRRNFSRAYLLYYVIAIALTVVLTVVFTLIIMAAGVGVMEELMYYSTIFPTFML